MINKVIRGFTRILGKPQNWDPEKHGECGALAIMDHKHEAVDGQPPMDSMISAWDVTPDELVRLLQGAPVYLRVHGSMHPPVSIWIGFPPLEKGTTDEPSLDELESFRKRITRYIDETLSSYGIENLELAEKLSKITVDARLSGRPDAAG